MSMGDDVAIVLGLGLLAYSGYQVHPALCWCVIGTGLVAIGIGGQILRNRKKDEKEE